MALLRTSQLQGRETTLDTSGRPESEGGNRWKAHEPQSGSLQGYGAFLDRAVYDAVVHTPGMLVPPSAISALLTPVDRNSRLLEK